MSERAGPLLTLAQELMSRGIPSLSVLIAQTSGAEEYAEFRRLIEVFLPEREQEILHHSTPWEQMASFASFFEDRYFPLGQHFQMGDVEGYAELTSYIPIVVMGISYDEYHEIAENYRPGCQLMTYLVVNPYEEGIDVSLGEACAEHVPQELLQRVPGNRLSPEEAHQLLNGTCYEGLALWADRIHASTENFFLDTDDEILMNSVLPEWDMGNVEALTRDWRQAEEQDNRVTDFTTWLEKDLPGHFEELLNFISEKRANGKTKSEENPSG